jgi:hypothetical protein
MDETEIAGFGVRESVRFAGPALDSADTAVDVDGKRLEFQEIG